MGKNNFVKYKVRELIESHVSGPSPTCEERNISGTKEWGLLKTTAVVWDGWNPSAHKVPPFEYWNNAKLEVKVDDILVTKAGPRKRVGVVVHVDETPPRLMVSGKMIGLRPKKDIVDSRVFAAALSSDETQRFLDSHKTGMAESQLNFTNELLLETEVAIPPREQHFQLGKLICLVNESIGKTESLIHKYQQIKAGLMHDLFSRGLTADGKLRPPREQAPELYQETPIGWIPKEWMAKKLKYILIDSGGYLQTGPFGSQLHAHEYTHEGVPVVMPQNINEGEIDTVGIARIPEKRAQLLHKHRLKIGDIIIARRGELNRAALITKNEKTWVCGTGCFLLRLGGSELDTRFFSYAYRHNIVQRQIAGLSVGTTMPSLNNTVMNTLYFPYIEIDEQNKICERLKLPEQHIKSLIEYNAKLKKQKSGLMHDLLTGKVQVKIDQQEAVHG